MAHWTLALGGGAQVVMKQLSEHFRSLGHVVDFVTTVEHGAANAEFLASCDKHWHFEDKGQAATTYLAAFRDQIVARDYDVLATHHSLQAVAVAGLLPTSTVNVSVVHTEPTQGAGFVALANPGAFDAYVGVSRGVGEAARRALGVNRRVEVILNGVPAGNCPVRPKREHIELLSVARLEERQKGILLLPSIVRLARDRGIPIRLTIIGDGEDRGRLMQAIEQSGVDGCVSLTGTLPQNEVFEHMESADILLLCSHHEGLALVLLEAMSRGCVPISTYLRESSAEVVTSGRDGYLVRDRSVAGFVDAIERLWLDPTGMQAMRRKARETATTKFGVEKMVKQYEALFDDLRKLPEDRSRIQYCPRFMNG